MSNKVTEKLRSQPLIMTVSWRGDGNPPIVGV